MEHQTVKTEKQPVSRIRRLYIIKLILRILVFFGCIYIYLYQREMLQVLYGFNFFKKFTPLHILWAVWVVNMLWQMIPATYRHLCLGSQKLFQINFRPIMERINYTALKDYIVTTTKSAYIVFIIWASVTVGIGIFYFTGVIDGDIIFLISVFFFVCDLICVLIWCPFRLIMRNRCCTTCRIFNWDHLMMFAPYVYIPGFFTSSLLVLALLTWMIWELCVMMYPERFWEMTNVALKCSECTDKLCTQYCQKFR